MAKAALEMAVLDAELRAEGRSFARELGAVHDRVPCGVSVGIMDSIPALLDAVGGYLDEGYVRIKLKIEPGWDVEPVRAVRERFGDGVLLQVDANTAYTLADARHLARLDPFDLLLIEQPLDEEDVLGHADLAKQIAHAGLPRRVHHLGPVGRRRDPRSAPPRSSTSSRAGSAATWRPGGSTTCARRTGSRCGAAGCSRPASAGPPTSLSPPCPGSPCPATPRRPAATTRADITEPFVLDDGHLAVPAGPGLGVRPLPDRLAEVTTATEWLSALTLSHPTNPRPDLVSSD